MLWIALRHWDNCLMFLLQTLLTICLHSNAIQKLMHMKILECLCTVFNISVYYSAKDERCWQLWISWNYKNQNENYLCIRGFHIGANRDKLMDIVNCWNNGELNINLSYYPIQDFDSLPICEVCRDK